jgi:hypothetical protein
VEGGFTIDDFTVDENARTVTCPAGLTRSVSARRYVTFGAACRTCPLRGRCTTATNGRCLNLHRTTRSWGPPALPGLPSPPCARTTRSTGRTSSG